MDRFTRFDEQRIINEQKSINKKASKAVNRISLLLIVMLGFSLIVSVSYRLLLETFWGELLDFPVFNELFSAVEYIISFLVPVYLAIKIEDERITDYLRLKGSIHKNFIPYTFFVVGLASVFAMLSSYFFGNSSDGNQMPDLSHYSVAAIVIWFVTTTVVPALTEEFIFRGYILNSLLPFGKGLAVCGSAVFFALMHSKDSVLFALCAGILFAYFTLETGNIKTAVLVHFINNCLSCMIYICEAFAPSKLYDLVSICYPIVIYSLMTVGALMLACRFNKIKSTDVNEYETCADIKSLITPIFVMAAILLLILK